MQDWELLRDFVKSGSQDSFGQLVERHLDFVYSACLREIGDTGLAEDATQVVFLLLAQKAATLREGTVLAGWLFQTARFVARNTKNQEARWRERNRKAAEAMLHEAKTPAPEPEEDIWTQIQPHLHDAMHRLGTVERDAVLLRCFKGYSLKATGEALGLTEEAARKRVSRALDKMRRYFQRRGVTLPAAVLASALTTHAVQAAPATLAAAGVVSGAVFQSLGGVAATTAAGAVGTSAGASVTSSLTGKSLVWAEMAHTAEQALLVMKVKGVATAVCGVSLATVGAERTVAHLRKAPQKTAQATSQTVRRAARAPSAVAPRVRPVASFKALPKAAPQRALQPPLHPPRDSAKFIAFAPPPNDLATPKNNLKIAAAMPKEAQEATPTNQTRNEAMQVQQVQKQVNDMKKLIQAAVLSGTLVAYGSAIQPAAAQPDARQGMAGNGAKPAPNGVANPLPQANVTVTRRINGGPWTTVVPQGANGAFNGFGDFEMQMLQADLQAYGVNDEAAISAIMEHKKRIATAEEAFAQKAGKFDQTLRAKADMPDAQFNQGFNDYQAALEDFKATREKSAAQLNEKTGYLKKPRLHAALLASGVVGDAPQGKAGLAKGIFPGGNLDNFILQAPAFTFFNGNQNGNPNGNANGNPQGAFGFDFNQLFGEQGLAQPFGNQPFGQVFGNGFADGGANGFTRGFAIGGGNGMANGNANGGANGFAGGNGGANGFTRGFSTGNGGGFANGGGNANGFANGFGNGFPNGGGQNFNANNADLANQLKALREEIERLKAEKAAPAPRGTK